MIFSQCPGERRPPPLCGRLAKCAGRSEWQDARYRSGRLRNIWGGGRRRFAAAAATPDQLHGPEHFQRNCQNVPGAAEAAAGAAAASAVCIYYVIIGGALRPCIST